jgi:eukaryotic-like serine/threonine-protein kinase
VFHVKHRPLALFAFGLILLVLASGCVTAPSPRGWAAPVQGPDGNLLVTTSRGKLDALNQTTGERVWRFPDDWAEPENRDARRLRGIYAAPIVADGTVYIADYNGFLYAIRPADLQAGARPEPRVRRLGSPVIGGMALDAASNTLFVTTDDGRLHALDAADFTNRFEPVRAGDRIWSPPTLAGGRVFFASTDRKLYAIDAASGRPAWEPFASGGSLVTQPVVANNNVIVGGFNNRLYALDASDGRERWSFTATNWIWGRPYTSGDTAYVADFDGKVYAISLSRGETVWSEPYSAPHSIRSAPVLASGVLLIVTERGELHGIRPADGSRAWAPVQLGGTVHADLVEIGDSVIVSPSSCVERVQPDDTKRKVNYFVVDAATGAVTAMLSDRGC